MMSGLTAGRSVTVLVVSGVGTNRETVFIEATALCSGESIVGTPDGGRMVGATTEVGKADWEMQRPAASFAHG